MKIRTNYKLPLATSVFLLATSQLNLVQAEGYPYSNQNAQPVYNPSYQNYPGNLTPGYTRPYNGGRNYGRDSNFSPRGGSGPGFSGPWDSGRGNSMPWNSGRGGSGPGFSGPWDSGRGNSMPWDSRRGGSGPGFSGPWDSGRGGRSMPWGGSRGGRSMPWDDSGRGGWMDKDRFADRWDDMLNAPSDMGEMPGGFNAPSVSVPNPVDVGDEFDDAARDVPDQMRNVYDENRQSK